MSLLIALFGGPDSGSTQEPWGPGESDVMVSEIHFHPAQEEEKQELLELYNSGVEWVDLGGWQLTAGVEYTFPEGVILPPAGFLVVARSAAAVKALYKIENVVGDFKGNLSNTGEMIELRNRGGATVLWVAYGDGGRGQGFWPGSADGEGPSCELISPHPDWHRSWFWRASLAPGGTPGRENSRLDAWRGVSGGAPPAGQLAGLAINELRLGSGAPFVELWNGGVGALKLDGLKLTRDPLGAGGVPVAGSLARRKGLVLDAAQAQGLAEGGKRLYLLKSDSLEIVDSIPVHSNLPNEGSDGRYPDGDGDLVAYAKASPGAGNAKPSASDLVINEILFHGRSVSEKSEKSAKDEKNDEEEFIEIFNRGKAAVPLKGWKIDRAVSFSFPDEAVLPAGGHAVVSNHPEKLRSRLSPEEQKLLFGPLKGKLPNSQGTVALVSPTGDTSDRVPYKDRAPWPAGADGGGASLELLHPDLDNRWGQAWTLGPSGGTPGKKNGRAVANMAPVLSGVRSEPAIPSPDDEVTIHAHVLDTGSLSEVSLVFRDVSSNTKASKKSMADSGEVEDGAPKDGHYAVRLGKLRSGVILGFYVLARDTSGKTARWPEGDRECFLQVEPQPREAPRHPELTYHILMPREAWDRFRQTSPQQDTKFPCTLAVTLDSPGSRGRRSQAFHGATIRYRGRTSRRPPDGRMSYRVFLAPGDSFDGRDRVILNSQSPLRQKAGGELMRLAGVPAPDVALIRLKTPGFEDEQYLDVEGVNNEFLDKRYGSSAGGIYRGDVMMTRNGNGRSGSADLSYQGPDKSYYLNTYLHGNKHAVDDVGSFIKALQAVNTKGAAYAEEIAKAIDMDEWATYFAANHVLKNDEHGLSTGDADDYFIAKRPSDGKFILIAWDHDSVFTHRMSRGDYEPIYGLALPVIKRFLWHPRVAPLYQAAIRRVIDGPLSRPSLAARLRTLEGRFPAADLADLDAFLQKRQGTVRARFVLWPQATLQGGELGDEEPIAGAGFGTRVFAPREAGAQAYLSGIVDPALAFKVKAGGEWANYDPVTGRWAVPKDLSALPDGASSIWIELVGAKGEVVQLHSIDLERAPAAHAVPRQIDGDVEWKGGSGPYVLQGPTVVPAGSTLKIGPGVDIVCAQGSSLQVKGTLLVEGSPLEPVTFRPSGAGLGWSGVRLAKSSGIGEGHRISHCRFEGGRGAVESDDPESNSARGSSSGGGFISIAGTKAFLDDCLVRGIRGDGIVSDSANVTFRGVRVVDGRSGILVRGGSAVFERCEVARLTGDGIRIQQCEKGTSLKGCVGRRIVGNALSIEASQVEIDSTLLVGSYTALAVSGGSRVKAVRLTLASSWAAIEMDRLRAVRRSVRGPVPAQPAGGKSTLEMTESVIGVVGEVVSGGTQQVRFARCVIAPVRGGDAVPGEGVLRELPRFKAGETGDFSLEAGSPGKSAGTGGTDWGAGL